MGCLCELFCPKRIDYNSETKKPLIQMEDKFLYQEAMEVIEMCIKGDFYYGIFHDFIKEMDHIDFENLFYGRTEYFEKRLLVNDKYIPKFNELVLKLEDIQVILAQWYKDPAKYKYIKQIFGMKYSLFNLVDKYEDQMDQILDDLFKDDIFRNSPSYIEDLRELKKLIRNSPQSRASDIKNYLRQNYQDFYSLIETSIENHNNIKEQKSKCEKKLQYEEDLNLKEIIKNERDNKNAYMKKAKQITNELINSIVSCLKMGGLEKTIDNEKEKDPEKIKQVIKETQKAFWNEVKQSNSSGVNATKLNNLIDSFNWKINYKSILIDVKNYFNNPLIAMSYLSMSFMNLYDSISSFYDDYLDNKENRTNFENRYRQIHSDFENHISEINEINLSNIDNIIEAERIIIEIGAKVEQDRINIIKLIDQINNEIENIRKKNKKTGGKLATNVLLTIGFSIMTIGTGGAASFIFGAAAAVNTAAMAVNSKHVVDNKKEIKNYKRLLEKANEDFIRIKNKLRELENKFGIMQTGNYLK